MQITQSLILFLLFPLISNGQSREHWINEINYEQSLLHFEENNSIHTLQIGLKTKNELYGLGQIIRNQKSIDYGIGMSKKFQLGRTSLTPLFVIREGLIYPKLSATLSASLPIKDSITMISSGAIHQQINNEKILAMDVGLIKTMPKIILISRLFNVMSSQSRLNPSSSISLMKTDEKNLIQLTLSGGRQNLIINETLEQRSNKYIGCGYWYQRQIKDHISASTSANFQRLFSTNNKSSIIFFNLTLNKTI